ncbi:phosphotransferase [Methylobacterium trifolii]|uniref:Thiamine kinase n=1 Tax=Methylobacterium trifolii TaxID=1003092 RepID=A0ABQ4U2S0_9HYPH|nr:phosphotransferase [Methylobacterium trifolii]GJE61769.1 Thiamine kinase [Methylobacterium trifolii]
MPFEPTHHPIDPRSIGHGRSSDVFAEGTERVIKLFVPGSDPAAIDNEFLATRHAWNYGLPVVEPIGILEREGRTGILFERAGGDTLLETHYRRPVSLVLALRRLAHLHRLIHVRPGGSLPSQHEILREEIGRSRISEAARRAALSKLDRLPRGRVLCHGDLHGENVLSTADGLRIIDWQKASSGHAAGDVARTELMIRFGDLKPPHAGRSGRSDRMRAWVAYWYVLSYVQEIRMHIGASDVRAWRLPIAAARLAGDPSGNEDAVRAEVERLAALS